MVLLVIQATHWQAPPKLHRGSLNPSTTTTHHVLLLVCPSHLFVVHDVVSACSKDHVGVWRSHVFMSSFSRWSQCQAAMPWGQPPPRTADGVGASGSTWCWFCWCGCLWFSAFSQDHSITPECLSFVFAYIHVRMRVSLMDIDLAIRTGAICCEAGT